ncbi:MULTISPECIES: NERD domain-containing protein [Acinetobacter]|uniref:NERD domain-containing protein n=1 Tax=Acinetobacter indicus TaxID=756892 RepID=A0A6C0Y657_9GAMM|nr:MULTISPECIES: NERD domain-containing protein [Acinetobacter]QIC71714.1 hypothetical protein FSC09_15065 [Acinetobacter indicus]QKQ71623.1 hypothetical protein E5Y90_15430 [Acinetobacter sp. 10FS3-1]
MNIQKMIAWLKFLAKKYCVNGLKGIYAEKLVSGYLKLFFSHSKRLNNVTLPYGSYTSQIDNILINEYGVFVIEVKNYKGFITATQNHDKWFVRYSPHKNAKVFKINSPFHQNIAHCRAVASVLRLPHSEPVNVVFFTNRADISFANGEYFPNICVGREIVDFIKSFSTPRYTPEQVEEFSQLLSSHRLSPSLSTDFYHVNNIKKRITDQEEARQERERQKIRDINRDVHAKADAKRLNHLRGQYSQSKEILQPKTDVQFRCGQRNE